MRVRDAMTADVLVVGRDHTLAEASRAMLMRRVGAAVVVDADIAAPGILTERDVMRAIAGGADCARTSVSEFMTPEARTAGAGWDLGRAAAEMCRLHVRHLIVVDGERMVGVMSMRDIVGARVCEEEADSPRGMADSGHSPTG